MRELDQLLDLAIKYPRTVRRLAMSKPQLALFSYVKRMGAVRSADVAAKFDITTNSAGARLRELASKGYLARTKSPAITGGIEYTYKLINLAPIVK
ncbi:MAG: hypothetical protein K0U41_02340 [Gammaproteobacteria bacterium]|nr:hypothetical protein [Gammaproteobacteria bacterium]